MRPTITSYLSFVAQPFFKYWWAALTGCASILALYITPASGVLLTGPVMMTFTFIMLTLLFLTFSVLVRGWRLFTERNVPVRVTSFERNSDVPGGHVFVLASNFDIAIGAVLDIHKLSGPSVEVPLALVQVIGRNSTGTYQAVPIGRMNPLHLREHTAGRLKPDELIVCLQVNRQRVQQVANEL